MDFTSGRYPLNDPKFSLGSYYNSDADKNTPCELPNLQNSIHFPKYGYSTVRHVPSDNFADDIAEDFNESENKLEDEVCDDIESNSTHYSSDSKARVENAVPSRGTYCMDDKMTAADDKRSEMEETNYIVKLEKMSPDSSGGVRETLKVNGLSDKKKNGIILDVFLQKKILFFLLFLRDCKPYFCRHFEYFVFLFLLLQSDIFYS
jgi:hypothetical protein